MSLDVALRHLRLTEAHADEVEEKLLIASAIIRDYLARPDDEDWTADLAAWGAEGSPTVETPGPVQAAVLVQLGELWRFRGDDTDAPDREVGHLSPMVRALLARYRDPVVR